LNRSDCEIDLNFGLLYEAAHRTGRQTKTGQEGQTKFQISDKPAAAPDGSKLATAFRVTAM
jgi:hypothetical protein